jgi:hypothetical protein
VKNVGSETPPQGAWLLVKQLTGLLIFTEHLHRTLIKRLFHHNIFRRTVVDKHQEACNLGEQLKEK